MTASMHRLARLLAPLLISSLLLAGCGAIDRAQEAALLLQDVQAGTADSALKRRTQAPSVEPLRYTIAGRTQVADRYQSGSSPRGSLVLIHGLTENGRRDPRLVEFAQSLARSGFRVLVPEIPGLTRMTVGMAERDDIATALRFATEGDGPGSGSDSSPEGAVGLAAMSLASGPAILAAMDANAASDVDYVVLVGGYYDIVDVIRYVTTGVDSGKKHAAPSRPMQEGKWLLLLSQLHHLDQPGDRAALQEIAKRQLRDEQAPVGDLVERLTLQGRAVYQLMTNTDPDRVEALIAKLPASVRTELAALNLSRRDLTAFQARVLLIHGANDRVIPLSQSQRLADALAPGQAELFTPPELGHVDIKTGAGDGRDLWRAAKSLFALTDRKSETK